MQYSLGNTPTRIQQAPGKGGTLQNVGPNVVYVGSNSSGALDFSIAVGASAPISSGSLWAYSPGGSTVTITSSVGVPSTVIPNYGVNHLLSVTPSALPYSSANIAVYNYAQVVISISPTVPQAPIWYGGDINQSNTFSTDDIIVVTYGDGVNDWGEFTYIFSPLAKKTIALPVPAPYIRLSITPGVYLDNTYKTVGMLTYPAINIIGYATATNLVTSSYIDDYSNVDTTNTPLSGYQRPYTVSMSHIDHPTNYSFVSTVESSATTVVGSGYVILPASMNSLGQNYTLNNNYAGSVTPIMNSGIGVITDSNGNRVPTSPIQDNGSQTYNIRYTPSVISHVDGNTNGALSSSMIQYYTFQYTSYNSYTSTVTLQL